MCCAKHIFETTHVETFLILQQRNGNKGQKQPRQISACGLWSRVHVGKATSSTSAGLLIFYFVYHLGSSRSFKEIWNIVVSSGWDRATAAGSSSSGRRSQNRLNRPRKGPVFQGNASAHLSELREESDLEPPGCPPPGMSQNQR